MSNTIKSFVAPLASLRLTVVLLFMSIIIVFAGTLAQVDKGIWTVVEEYFRCFVAWIPLKIFFQNLPDFKIPFPGGWLLGSILFVNLMAAHLTRFKVAAAGREIWAGLALVAAGVGLSAYVVMSTFDDDSSAVSVSPSWRITRQLLEGGGASLVLLAGFALIFKRRAGIVLLHSGIGLMMVNELWAGLATHEGHMTINEGQTVNFVEDSRRAELAIIDPSDPEFDDVVVIPDTRLRRESRIHHALLPFQVDLVTFMKNSELTRPGPRESNPATAGEGLQWVAVRRDSVTGVETEQRSDIPSAYVTFRDSKGDPLGTYLLSTYLDHPQPVTVGAKTYGVALRFARTYKPYSIQLIDFRFDKYVGTRTPQNYSSDVRVLDPARGVDRRVRIWMNNPLRYHGDTLYQASFRPDETGTVLQVVKNAGWMIPYLGCMIVATGLLAQFTVSLLGFLRKRRTTP